MARQTRPPGLSRQLRPAASLPPPINRTGQLIQLLSEEIRGRRYLPGERLPTEQEMVARFGVSRTVVREAIASMRAEGLVIARQGVGVFVAEDAMNSPFRIASEEVRPLAELLHVLQLRLAVEVEAAGLAASHRTPTSLATIERSLDGIDGAICAGRAAIEEDFAFHVAISAATGNPQFERFMRFLGTIIIPRQTMQIGMDDPRARLDYLRQLQVEHRAIHTAIRDNAVDAARRAARTHLENSRARYLRLSESQDH